MQIRKVTAELFHADGRTNGRTDRYDKANSLFSQFYRRAKKKKQTETRMNNKKLPSQVSNSESPGFI